MTSGLCRFWLMISVCLAASVLAQAAGNPPAPVAENALPDVSSSVIRLLGGLALVVALFLGGVWLFRNWQRVVINRGQGPKLNVLEIKSLGQRQTLYVVSYERERLLLAGSPSGVTLLTHLPTSDTTGTVTTGPNVTFADALQAARDSKP